MRIPPPPADGMCEWHCGNRATHYCNGCGKWICNSPKCNAYSIADSFGFPVERFLNRRE